MLDVMNVHGMGHGLGVCVCVCVCVCSLCVCGVYCVCVVEFYFATCSDSLKCEFQFINKKPHLISQK